MNILEVKNLKVHFEIDYENRFPWEKKHILKAVNGVDFSVKRGETLSIVGESGCGKSTLARAIVGLNSPLEGSIKFEGKEICNIGEKNMRVFRKEIQMIFQDPLSSLNPRMTIGNIVSEPLIMLNKDIKAKDIMPLVKDTMKKVGLLPDMINRYPHEFSGGQCQRIGIARAIIIEPKLLICDEPVSALDVSIQAQVINLLKDLQNKMNLSIIFIAHNLSVISHVSDRVMVMYLGNNIELASRDSIYKNPKHPYTKALLNAIPLPDPRSERNKPKYILDGQLPSPINLPSGCVFESRCTYKSETCKVKQPENRGDDNHSFACIKDI